MATAAQTIAGRTSSFSWLGQFLKEELSPYPGRFGSVARMVLATTIVMVVSMTFQLSFAFLGAIFALLLSHLNARSTLQSAFTVLLFVVLGAVYLLVSAWFVISIPMLHLLWVFASFFLAFYIINALNNYIAAAIFAVMVAVGVPLWDRHVPAERNVEDTLRLVLITMLGIAATLVVKLAFVHRKPGDQIVQPIVERLRAVEKLLVCVADGRPVDDATASNLARLGMVGTSRLRLILARSNYSPHFVEQMGAVTALTGKIVDTGANWPPPNAPPSDDDRKRVRRLAENLATICDDLLARRVPHLSAPPSADNASSAVPVLPELERIVALIPETFVGSHPLNAYVPPPLSGDPPQRIFAWDTESNREHIRFALRGCLTASLCYVIYNGIDWHGISISVTTCLLTALSTIGSSRQKQVLRFAGATLGGFVFGMGSQIFILPHLNSIGGFTVLFIVVTALSSWVLASSPRLSYFGLQMALGYYLVNLQEFAFQTSLATARDRVVGVLFGLLMMWFVFDQLWGAPAWVAMKKTFIANLRLQAQLAREPVSTDIRRATEKYFSLREMIGERVDSVRSFADGVVLEFGASRERALEWRRQILACQPQLRILFLTQVALWKYHAKLPGYELPEPVRLAQREFDDQTANMLDGMADRIEGKTPVQETDLKSALTHLDQTIQAFRSEQPRDALAPQIQTYISLSTRAESLATSLDNSIRESVL
jgi:multidrug resistance protein MdtO